MRAMTETEPSKCALMCAFGCVTTGALRALAEAIDRLEAWHISRGGSMSDHPCLRRIEASGYDVMAHVSTGPPVGGTWIVFALGPNGWRIFDDP